MILYGFLIFCQIFVSFCEQFWTFFHFFCVNILNLFLDFLDYFLWGGEMGTFMDLFLFLRFCNILIYFKFFLVLDFFLFQDTMVTT